MRPRKVYKKFLAGSRDVRFEVPLPRQPHAPRNAMTRSLMLHLRGCLTALSVLFCLAASHAGESADRVSTARVPGGAMAMKAQAGADGTIHLLCNTAGGPQYLRSQDGGSGKREL